MFVPESELHDLRYLNRPTKRRVARRCATLVRPAVQQGLGGATYPCLGLATHRRRFRKMRRSECSSLE